MLVFSFTFWLGITGIIFAIGILIFIKYFKCGFKIFGAFWLIRFILFFLWMAFWILDGINIETNVDGKILQINEGTSPTYTLRLEADNEFIFCEVNKKDYDKYDKNDIYLYNPIWKHKSFMN